VTEAPERLPIWVQCTAVAIAVLIIMAVIAGMAVY